MTSPVLRFPTPNYQPAPSPSQPSPYPALAVIIGALALVFIATGAFWAGRHVEAGTQLGQVLALAPLEDSLRASLARSDSLMRRLTLLGKPPRPQSTLPRKVESIPIP